MSMNNIQLELLFQNSIN